MARRFLIVLTDGTTQSVEADGFDTTQPQGVGLIKDGNVVAFCSKDGFQAIVERQDQPPGASQS